MRGLTPHKGGHTKNTQTNFQHTLKLPHSTTGKISEATQTSTLSNNKLPQILPTTNLPTYLLERAGLEATIKRQTSAAETLKRLPPTGTKSPPRITPKIKSKTTKECLKEGLIQPS